MTNPGKINASFFDHVIGPNLGAEKDDVKLHPTPGIDFGVIDVEDRSLVVSTDPISILTDLGLERSGRLATDIVLTDVAVSGIAPSHLTVSLTLPMDFSTETLSGFWRGVDAHATKFDVSIVAGHTGRYPSVGGPWIGAATALGFGQAVDIVRPDGAQPGNAIVMSTGPAAEVAGLFATQYPDKLGLDPETVATAQERVTDIVAVGDALAAHDVSRITAMHDATEGGIAAGLVEMADGAGARFELDRESVPVGDGVRAVCNAVDLDPWSVTSCGTLLITVEQADASTLVETLEQRGTLAAIVGRVKAGTGVYASGERVEPPEYDPSWSAALKLAEES